MFRPGRTYRHPAQTDVDMFVRYALPNSDGDWHLQVYWCLRSSGRVMTEDAVTVRKQDVAKWRDLNDSEGTNCRPGSEQC